MNLPSLFKSAAGAIQSPALRTLAGSVATMAPTLATMLGGPFAGMAVTALETAFGLPQGAGPDAITAVVQGGGMTPDIVERIRAADQKHAEVMRQGEIDLARMNAEHEELFAKVDAADRASAREMQVKIHSAWPGWITLLTTLAVAAELIARHVPGYVAPNDTMTAQIIGTLLGVWVACTTYWVGSTRQSANNQNALAAIAKEP